MKIDHAMQQLAKAARFEAGKPADPTKHMSPEDAAKWKDMNEEHRDKFKTALKRYQVGDAVLIGNRGDEYQTRATVVGLTKSLVKYKVKLDEQHKRYLAGTIMTAPTTMMSPDSTFKGASDHGSRKELWVLGNDGALFGSTDDPDGSKPAFWKQYLDLDDDEIMGDYSIFRMYVPTPIADQILENVSPTGLRARYDLFVAAWKRYHRFIQGSPVGKVAAGDIPADVERYVKETKESNPDYDDSQLWAVAWSRYCKYKNPGSEHCKMNTNDYFKGAMEGLTKMAATRSLSEIAAEIRKDWRPVNYAAKPYLEAMEGMESISDNYYQDSGFSIVSYFLSNASGWKGDTAKRIKAELKSMLSSKRGSDMDSLVVACGGILAEGCPDNLDDADCKSWESNTEKYKNVVKDQHQATWDEGEIDKDNPRDRPGEGSMIPGLEERLAGLVNDAVMSEPDNSMRKNPLDPMATWEEGEIDLNDDPRDHESEGSMIPGLEDRLASAAHEAMLKTAGHTVSWEVRREIPPEKWAKITTYAIKAIAAFQGMKKLPEGSKYLIEYPDLKGPFKIKGPSGSGSPEITEDDIYLNGDKGKKIVQEYEPVYEGAEPYTYRGDQSHETFHLSRFESSDFCKTVWKPYDMVVKTILAYAKKIDPGALRISADGGAPITVMLASSGSMMAELEMLAEGCPDNLEGADCDKWEANTDKYKDVVKDQHQASITPQAGKKPTPSEKAEAKKLFDKWRDDADGGAAMDDLDESWQSFLDGEISLKNLKANAPDKTASDILQAIHRGDRVTIVNRFQQESTGTAVMRGPAGWVLNMGGPHGTPGIATDENIVKVKPAKRGADDVDEKAGKFEKGKPADPTKDMSSEDAAEWEKQNDEHKDNFKSAGVNGYIAFFRGKKIEVEAKSSYEAQQIAAKKFGARRESDVTVMLAEKDGHQVKHDPMFASLESQWNSKAASDATGLYGYTRAIQSSCESSIRKMMATATKVAKEAYRKDENVAPFLAAHAKRGNSLSAKILVAAMKTIGPKVASEMRKAELKAEALPAEKLTKAAAKKYGLYGYAAKTASLGLHACTTIRETAGSVTSDMHGRKADSHKLITGFLSAHAKEAKCMYSKMLCASYPDADRKTASVVAPVTVGEWLSWED